MKGVSFIAGDLQKLGDLMLRATLLLSLGVVFVGPRQAAGQASPQPGAPIQAELLVPLDSTHVRVGSPVLARVAAPWEAAGCKLAVGGMVRGHVVELTKRSKAERNSRLALLFDGADCKGNPEEAPRFTLAALIGGLPSTGQSGVAEGLPLSNDLPLTIGGGGGGLRNAHAASAITDNFALQARRLPATITPGEVIDLEKVQLEVSGGPEGASSIIAVGRNVRLEAGTVLILTRAWAPLSAPGKTAPGKEIAGAATSRTAGPGETSRGLPSEMAAVLKPAPAEETAELCSANCTNLVGGGAASVPLPNRAAAVLSLRALGYLPSGSRQMTHFEADTTVTFLNDRVLLCTFDPHRLRERLGGEEDSARTVRAVLVDSATSAVVRVLDWRVRGDGQYLWRLPGGHVLLHAGRELRELDAALKPVRSLPLAGKLAWVVSSPSGEYIATGTIRERYSQATRHDLEAVLPEAAEEDVEIRVFNKRSEVMLTASHTSKSPTPVLSDGGELRLTRRRPGLWLLDEIGWDQGTRNLGTIHSACRPTLSVLPGELVFVAGCTPSGGRWYRVLRRDGHPVLKAEYVPDEMEQEAVAGAEGSFAVRVVHADHPLSQNQPFRLSDLRGQTIAIHSAENGARLAAVSSTDFAPSKLGFAVAPDGRLLAIAGREGLLFFPLEAGRAHAPISQAPPAAGQGLH